MERMPKILMIKIVMGHIGFHTHWVFIDKNATRYFDYFDIKYIS